MKGKNKKEQLAVIYRHWRWCDCIKSHLYLEWEKTYNLKISELSKCKHIPKSDLLGMPFGHIGKPLGGYWFIWYGLLFVVLKGLKDEDIKIPDLEEDIKKIYEPLRKFRNAVFHTQKKYWSDKFYDIQKDSKHLDIIWKVHHGVGKYLKKANKA